MSEHSQDCEYCGRHFARSYGLKRHKEEKRCRRKFPRTLTGKYECGKCGWRSKSDSSIYQHIKSNHTTGRQSYDGKWMNELTISWKYSIILCSFAGLVNHENDWQSDINFISSDTDTVPDEENCTYRPSESQIYFVFLLFRYPKRTSL